jgi:hypothetical protein
MGRLELLAERYGRHIATPWQKNLAGAQKIIFVVYDKADERRLRTRRKDFEIRTRDAAHVWREFDFTDTFGKWMAAQEYRDEYFSAPEDLLMKLESDFADCCARELEEVLGTPDADENAVVGVFGCASLYGLTRLSSVLGKVEPFIRGRLTVFFPGTKDGNNYRLLDARDGWSYLAVAIASDADELTL